MSTTVAGVHRWVLQEAASSTSAAVDSSTSHQQATECCDMCTECQQLWVMVAGLKGTSLRKHMLDGHRSCSDKCSWCV